MPLALRLNDMLGRAFCALQQCALGAAAPSLLTRRTCGFHGTRHAAWRGAGRSAWPCDACPGWTCAKPASQVVACTCAARRSRAIDEPRTVPVMGRGSALAHPANANGRERCRRSPCFGDTAEANGCLAEGALGDTANCATVCSARPNVRAKRATTAGRQARAGKNVHRTSGRALVACRWRSA